MKLTVLTENMAGNSLLAEHGLSYFVEQDNTKILFDTGHTDIFLKNARKLNIDIAKTETVVLSHGHWDHGNGLQFLNNKKLIAHPKFFMKRYHKNDNENIGLALDKEEINNRFQLITSSTPYEISKNIIFLGEIPRKNSFESKTTSFVDENGEPDFVPDDSGLVIIDNDELVIISGCAHSGICNIIDHAISITGITKIKGVIGGFHLKHNNKQTQKTIQFFKEQNIKYIYPSHCTELEALSAFNLSFPLKQVKTGMVFEFD